MLNVLNFPVFLVFLRIQSYLRHQATNLSLQLDPQSKMFDITEIGF